MIVTLSAGHRESQPRCARRIYTVEQVIEALLLGDRASFAIEQVVAIEATGDFLIVCGLLCRSIWQQIARQLLD